MASVRKRKWEYKGVVKEGWVVEYTDPSGTRRRKKAGSKKEADRLRLQIEVEIEGGTHTPDRQSVLVREMVEAWVADCERRHAIKDRMAGYTLVVVRGSAKKIIERFGARRAKDLKSEDVQMWVDELSLRYRRNTIQARYVHLIQALKFGVKRKWIKRNILIDDPCQLPRARKEEVRIPTKDQMRRLIQAIEDPNSIPQYQRNHLTRKVFIYLALFAGLRRGEIAGLQWENVDFAAGMIRVRHNLSSIDGLKDPKSHAGSRDVPMAPQLRFALLEVYRFWTLRARIWRDRGHIKGDEQSTLTKRFAAAWARGEQVRHDDEPLTGYVLRKTTKKDFGVHASINPHHLGCQHLDQVMLAAGLVDEKGKNLFTTHGLRHACISLLIEHGLPAFNLKTIIGHQSVTTTYNVYGHLFPGDGRSESAVEAISGAFGAPKVRQTDEDAIGTRLLEGVSG